MIASDQQVGSVVGELEAAVALLGGADVEAHKVAYSDERLKRAVRDLDRALEGLRQLDLGTPSGKEDDRPDVEAHKVAYSDERLKQAITDLQDGLGALKTIDFTPSPDRDGDADVEAHWERFSDERLKTQISKLEGGLEVLKQLRVERERKR